MTPAEEAELARNAMSAAKGNMGKEAFDNWMNELIAEKGGKDGVKQYFVEKGKAQMGEDGAMGKDSPLQLNAEGKHQPPQVPMLKTLPSTKSFH